ncbi:MAG: prepilin-type N-terminal cleavage/methylation domain-containing protein [Acidimicrobiia bacterium]
MNRFRSKLLRGEGGMTLVELMVSMLLMSFIATALVAGMTTAMRSANLHRDDDRAVQDLRHAKERLTRELRAITELTGASASSVTFWLDEDADGIVDLGETITWEITTGGSLVRSTNAGASSSVVSNLVAGSSGFTFDAAAVGEIRRIGIELTAAVGSSDGTRSIQTEIFLRNAP